MIQASVKEALFRAMTMGATLSLVFSASAQSGDGRRVLQEHAPQVIARLHLKPLKQLPDTNQLHLAIGLPLRNKESLTNFLKEIYDPASTNFHHYLTPGQFTERFGPTEQDYQKVVDFAKRNGLTVTKTYANRTLLDVSGNAATVEKAFHVTLRVYQHPKDARHFYAPDTEPWVETNVPILDVSGLDNYSRPKPMLIKKNNNSGGPVSSGTGSGAFGAFLGNDFRAAYLPDTTLTGEGQIVGLVEFDGYYANDITNYVKLANQPIVPLQNILIDGFDGNPTSDDLAVGEVSLDIEMALAMAPCLSKIVVFEGSPNNSNPNHVLASMVEHSEIKQLSSSWGWGRGPSGTTENYFLQMQAQGQSYFNASGDSDAFPPGSVDNTTNGAAPSSSPYITQVGGTTLTTSGAGGAWSSETVWNWGNEYGSANDGIGSSGGVSSYYSIPDWQTGIDMTTNHGSTAHRNIPDVALTADNIYVIYNNGELGNFGGTSCAAPLWAGVMALINQQAVGAGRSPAGFLNPAIYAIGKSNIYTSNFHDITTGNNFWSGSTTNFLAVSGYDLCTGWGTPDGQTFITTLAGLPDDLEIFPTTNLVASGIARETFAPLSQNILLTNSGIASLNWAVTGIPVWLDVSSTSGGLVSGGQTTIVLTLNASTTNLAPGYHFADLLFTNFSSHGWQSRRLALQVLPWLSISPSAGFSATGPAGGPFSVTSQTFTLSNLNVTPLNWSLINTSSWLTASSDSGTLAGNSASDVVIGLNTVASNLADGFYSSTVIFTNETMPDAQFRIFTLSVGLIQNGGFETGDFTGWDLTGDEYPYNFVDSDPYVTGMTAHHGSYFAALGEAFSLAYLSQNIVTTSGQLYLLSLWMNSSESPYSDSDYQTKPNEFSVAWNGETLFDEKNIPIIGWTNLQFLVTATAFTTSLQIGARDDYNYLGLDDVTLKPVSTPVFQASVTDTNDQLNFSWNATTGLVYQVQFKTNLLQPDWIVLKSITATNTAAAFTDTNPIIAAPQKFYRLRLLP